MDLLVWGESLLKHRTLLAVSLIHQIIEVARREIQVNAKLVTLGEEANTTWDVRLFPLVVIITIFLSGMMVPATSLVEEKVKRTYRALLTTPASLVDILTVKGSTGVILALFNGLLIFFMNDAFGTRPVLFITLLSISSIFAAAVGIIMEVLVKDINTLFTIVKSLGIVLYAPAFISIFPEIPQWVAKIFPTYYTDHEKRIMGRHCHRYLHPDRTDYRPDRCGRLPCPPRSGCGCLRFRESPKLLFNNLCCSVYIVCVRKLHRSNTLFLSDMF